MLEQYELSPLTGPKFDGPVALLVGDATVSAAENFSQMIANAMDLVAVGRPSAATNGNITGVQLPGAMGFTFTGMEVRNPRGSQFHGIGIVPEVVVVPTAAELAAGTDPELAAAIGAVTAPTPRPGSDR